MKKRYAKPLAHCGRMTKTELICHLIAAVLREWNVSKLRQRTVARVEGNSVEPTPARRASIVTMI